MPKYTNIAIVASFIGLWISSFFSSDFQLTAGFLLIFTFGILHGANDIALLENLNNKNKALTFSKILTYYVIIVIMGSSLFYFMPTIALTIFVLVSGYHFGEQQWNEQLHLDNFWLKISYQTTYGLLILFSLFVCHTQEVQRIIHAITLFEPDSSLITIPLYTLLVLFITISAYLFFSIKSFRKCFFLELFYLLVFLVIFKVASLIWGFAIYFIIWHSVPSMLQQIEFLFGEISSKNFILYFRKAFLYWIFSLIGILLLYIFFSGQKVFNAIFFSFLASITFPHVFVMRKMFGKI